MEQFIEFATGQFYNGHGVALYEIGRADEVLARAETVPGGKVLGQRIVPRDWVDELPGNRLGRLAAALESLTGGKLRF